MSSRRFRFALVGLASMLLLGVGVAVAGGAASDKLRTGEEVAIGEGETVTHDLYVFAGAVVVNGTVEGDLVAAAGFVTINGTVNGDLVVGSGQVSVNGEVSGDVRAGAGSITIDGTVGEDLLALAGGITITDGGEVGEDLIFAAGEVLVDGAVSGNVLGTASSYVRNGTVGGDEDVTIETGGGIPDPTQPDDPVRIAGEGLRQWVTVLIFGGLGLLLVPGVVRASEGALRRRPLASAGIGLGILLGYVIQFVAVLLLMSLLALALASITLDALAGVVLWLGLLDLFVTTFALVVAAAFLVDVVVGLGLAQLAARGWAANRWQEFALLAAGSFVVVLVTVLPGIGALAKLVVIVMGLGAMGVAFGEWWSRRRPPPETPPFTPAAAGLAPGSEPPASPSESSTG